MMDFYKYPQNSKYFKTDMLFHYTSMETAIEKILTDKRLKFSSFKNVNDPSEKGLRSISINWSSSDEIDKNKIDTIQYHKTMNRIRLDESRLICFSRNFDNIHFAGTDAFDFDKYYRTGFFKPRMWAQYGNKHKGVVLAFSRDELASEINKAYKTYDFYRGPIKYSDSIQAIRKAYHVTASKEMLDDFRNYYIKTHLIKYREELFFTKNTDWKDENEYRFLLITPNDQSEYFIDINSSIRAVFCGIDVHEAYIHTIKEITKGLDIDIFKLSIADGIPHVNKK